ncbi:MAG TPA: NAD(P)-dependent oxidoreductase, partial [Saprospiraceae bacterium]|nr:NAD(P)-dependent oxidoreductase [Saprospiraceae bacterium]
ALNWQPIARRYAANTGLLYALCSLHLIVSDILRGKTALITGGSRGIGFAIGKRLAQVGVRVVLAAKTTTPHPKLPGTIYTAAEEINQAGGKALAVALDVRDEEQIQQAVSTVAEHFGGIDILVNNASAIYLAGVEQTPARKFDLMHQINVRGTFLMSRACIPFLKQSTHAHILNLSPPLDLSPKWFESHTAYTMTKYNMSMIALGLAAELKPFHIGVNCIWPKTLIATSAVQNLLGGDALMRQSRWPAIVADAALAIFSNDPAQWTGRFFIDEDLLRSMGITDFSKYAVDPTATLAPDLFIET